MKRKRDLSARARMSACADDDDSAKFDVFLSFSGPDNDTHLNFIDGLYNSLIEEEILVFRDDGEIRKGEKIGDELLDAIESFKIYMPILSRNYASSAWCLRVLMHMLESSSKANNKVIVPIFYEVNPDDAKLKTNLYLDSMEKHEEKFGRDNVRRWKEALTEVAKLEGWALEDKGHGELISTIAWDVSISLSKRRVNLPRDLVGIGDRVEAIINMLNEGSHDVRYLVIHGMAGIGKTTLASVVYNRICYQFQDCGFLSNVRLDAQHGGIVKLQALLLSVMFPHRSPRIYNSIDDIINIIRERFHDKKILIVLDDVNKWDQVSELAGRSDCFGPGSRIIITTRDINFLPIKEEDKESSFQLHSKEFKFYEMTEMDSSDALRFFSKCAFKMDFPPHDFDDISCKIVAKTGGLPLALVIIAYFLYHKNKEIWEHCLEELNDTPSMEVLHKLEISFDILEPEQREIFCNMACFFIGKERLHPYFMWKASNYSPRSNLLVLTRMFLIKITNDDTLSMHKQLQGLGVEIVRREDFRFPRKQSRMWEPETAFRVVRMKKGIDKVMALRLTGLSIEYDFANEEFSKMPNLKILELEGGNLIGDFKNLLSKLTWLSWSNCPSELHTTNLCLKKLTVLKLSGSNITENWAGWRTYLVSKDLKVIEITQCPNLRRTPDVSKCSKLKRLVLQGGKTSLVANGSLSKLVVHGFCQD